MKHTRQTTSKHRHGSIPQYFQGVGDALTPSQHSLIVAMALISGISLGYAMLPSWGDIFASLGFGLAVIAMTGLTLILVIRGNAVTSMFSKIASLVMIGILLASFPVNNGNNITPPEISSFSVSVKGHVAMAEVMRGDRQRIRLKPFAYEHRDDSTRKDSTGEDHAWPIPREWDIRLIAGKENVKLAPGDVITGMMRINAPLPQLLPDSFDFTAHAHRQGFGATGFINDIEVRGHAPAAFAPRLRFHIQKMLYEHLEPDHAAVASALLVGLRAGLTPAIREDFRKAGLSHLLAISGLHMALFWGSVMAALRAVLALFPHFASRYPSLKIAAVAAMPFGVFYLIISGMPVSAVRAFVMLGLFMLAVLMTRRGVTLHHVALAAIGILVIDPSQVTQPAFQMSFAAVFALVAGWMALVDRRWDVGLPRIVRYLGGIMIGSLLAGVVTAPFVLHHFGVTSMWSILGNVLGMPLMAFVIMPFGAMSLLLMPFGLDALPLAIMGFGIDPLLTAAHYIAELPLSSIVAVPPTSMVLYLYTLGLVGGVILPKKTKIGAVMILAVSIAVWSDIARPVAAVTMLHNRPLAAISDGSTIYYSRKSATAFERSVITRPFGLVRHDYIGTAPRHHSSSVLKDVNMITVGADQDLTIALIWQSGALQSKVGKTGRLKLICPLADLIVVMRSIEPEICREKVITLRDISRHGGVLIVANTDEFMLTHVDGTKRHIPVKRRPFDREANRRND